MSHASNPNADDKASQTDVGPTVRSFPLDRTTRSFDSQGITINFYSGNCSPHSEKPVQTESSCSDVLQSLSKIADSKSRKHGNLSSESRELRCFEYAPTTAKKSIHFFSNESKLKSKLMSSRKNPDKSAGRAAIDLERKKLEAELKATEEIARIKQMVIEKRLALELATLQDGVEYPHRSAHSQLSIPNADRRMMEEAASRKPNPMEQSASQEMSPTTRVQPPRPPPPARPPPPDGPKLCSTKPDTATFMAQTSSELNPIRNLIEKKFYLEKRSSRVGSKEPSPTQSSSREYRNHQDFRQNYLQDYRYAKDNKSDRYSVPGYSGGTSRTSTSYRARSLWKSAMMKIKKKLKPIPKP